MRTVTNDLGDIAYPDEICFAFNPTYIKVTDCPALSLVTTVSNGEKTFPIETMCFSRTAIINISRALQLMFDVYNIVEKRSMKVSVDVSDGTHTFTFTSIAIWGNIAPGERFNGERVIRWFKNYPMKVSIFDGASFQEIEPVTGTVATLTPWDYTFDYTFHPASAQIVTCIEDNATDGVFLRWIDRHGRLQYWLFEKGVKEIKNDDGGQELTMNYVDKKGNSFRSIKRQQYFFSETKLNLCAPNVDEAEFNMLESILTSPVIDLYHKDAGVGWEPVVIDTSTSKRKVTIMQDFEFKILLPNTNAQML